MPTVEKFAKKYNLQNNCNPIRISKQTQQKITTLLKNEKQMLKAGKAWARRTAWRIK